jgi:hypothetical protein
MPKSIFISCLHEEKNLIEKLHYWSKTGEFDDIVFIHAMEEDKRVDGDDRVRQYIIEQIDKTTAIAVLVGRDTHNHKWITWEVDIAQRRSKKIFCIRIPETTGGVPSILSGYPEIKFKMDDLKKSFSILK